MRRTAHLLAVLLLACSSACNRQSTAAPATGASRWTAVEDLVRKKEFAAAATALEAMRGPSADDPDVILRLAEVRRLQGEQAKAILILREALEKNPAARILYVPLASLYLQVGDAAAARLTLEKGRTLGAEPAAVAMTLGTALGRLNESEAALREFDAALAAGADANVVLYNRALVLGQLKRHGEAVAALETVVAAKPEWPAGRRELARAILDGVPRERAPVERALDLLINVSPELPEDWRVNESIGDAWLLLGDYDAALMAYTDALRLGKNPKQVEQRYVVAARKIRERDEAAAAASK